MHHLRICSSKSVLKHGWGQEYHKDWPSCLLTACKNKGVTSHNRQKVQPCLNSVRLKKRKESGMDLGAFLHGQFHWTQKGRNRGCREIRDTCMKRTGMSEMCPWVFMALCIPIHLHEDILHLCCPSKRRGDVRKLTYSLDFPTVMFLLQMLSGARSLLPGYRCLILKGKVSVFSSGISFHSSFLGARAKRDVIPKPVKQQS